MTSTTLADSGFVSEPLVLAETICPIEDEGRRRRRCQYRRLRIGDPQSPPAQGLIERAATCWVADGQRYGIDSHAGYVLHLRRSLAVVKIMAAARRRGIGAYRHILVAAVVTQVWRRKLRRVQPSPVRDLADSGNCPTSNWTSAVGHAHVALPVVSWTVAHSG